ncbi:hypothetical protein TNCV_873501 [Trichonephila clavipes]|nr:hypothetical protein TNCV_873501 [Trichonephila clavipes]
MNSILVPLKSRRVVGLVHVKSVEAQSPPFGLIWKFAECTPAQVSSSSLDRGSKLRVFINVYQSLVYMPQIESEGLRGRYPTLPSTVTQRLKPSDRNINFFCHNKKRAAVAQRSRYRIMAGIS